jgi:hypothetical protein
MCFPRSAHGIVLSDDVIMQGTGEKCDRAWKWKVVTRRDARRPRSSEGRPAEGDFFKLSEGDLVTGWVA